MDKRKIVRGLIWFFVFTVFVYTVFLLSTDARKNIEVFKKFEWGLLPGVLGLVLVNFLLREVKWDFFRRRAGVEAPRVSSWLIFFSGYSMCISPGRVGELIKPVLYKEYHGASLKKTIPLVFCERLTDLLGMIVVCLATVSLYMRDYKAGLSEAKDWSLDKVLLFFGLSMALLAAGIGMARWRGFVLAVFDRLAATKLAKPAEKLRHLYEETYSLLTFFNIGLMTLLAAFSWFFECLAMFVVCHGVGIATTAGGPVALHHCAFIFCIASILGGLAFFFPGGMGPVEFLMTFLLVSLGAPLADSNATMFLTRFCTLIFGAALGFFFLGATARYHHDKNVLGHVAEAIDDNPNANGSAPAGASSKKTPSPQESKGKSGKQKGNKKKKEASSKR
jgi:uncharacterized protein (TIRG00374 family)